MKLVLKFREQLNAIGVWMTTELDQIFSALKTAWLTEHTEDDGHGDITAYSITLTKDENTGKTGDVEAGGDGTFGGDVTAQSATKPVSLGAIGALAEAGVRVRSKVAPASTDNDWEILVGLGGAARQLSIRDVLEVGDASMLDIVRTGVSAYDIRPHSGAQSITLGTNAVTKFASAATLLGYYERGRTPPIGEWTPYSPGWVSGGVANTIGNGSLIGAFAQVGQTTLWRIQLAYGTTTVDNNPGGVWEFSLPHAAVTTGQKVVGLAESLDAGVAAYCSWQAVLQTATTFILASPGFAGTPSTSMTNANPYAIGNNDILWVQGSYERT